MPRDWKQPERLVQLGRIPAGALRINFVHSLGEWKTVMKNAAKRPTTRKTAALIQHWQRPDVNPFELADALWKRCGTLSRW
jgi:translation initiation factor 1 (eIF-1/SUI1)